MDDGLLAKVGVDTALGVVALGALLMTYGNEFERSAFAFEEDPETVAKYG